MWQLLLILISISFVSCQTNCPGFSNYKNNATLLSVKIIFIKFKFKLFHLLLINQNLNEEYIFVKTSSNNIHNCERISYTLGSNNNLTAHLKDADGCCRRIDKFDSSNPDYFQHDITPLNKCSHLQSAEKVGTKLVASVGAGMDLCLFIYSCHNSQNGLYIICRHQPKLSQYLEIGKIMMSLHNASAPIPYMKKVNQSNCIFCNNCSF